MLVDEVRSTNGIFNRSVESWSYCSGSRTTTVGSIQSTRCLHRLTPVTTIFFNSGLIVLHCHGLPPSLRYPCGHICQVKHSLQLRHSLWFQPRCAGPDVDYLSEPRLYPPIKCRFKRTILISSKIFSFGWKLGIGELVAWGINRGLMPNFPCVQVGLKLRSPSPYRHQP